MQASVLTEVFLPIALAAIMLGMGLTLTWDDFRRVTEAPKAVLIGLLAQIVGLPLLGLAIIALIPTDPKLALGLVIITLCPGGPTSNLITFLARGDAALSVTLTAVSSVVTVFTTPLLVNLLIQYFLGSSQTLSLPVAETIGFLFAITLIPVAIGMVIKRTRPAWATASETWFKLLSLAILAIIILAALIREAENIIPFFAQAGVVSLLLNVLGVLCGAGLAWFARLGKPQAISIAVDTGNCNGTQAILITATLLREPAMTVAPAVYSLIMLALGFAVIQLAPRLEGRKAQTLPVKERTLGRIFLASCAAYRARPAMHVIQKDGTKSLTYADLEARVYAYSEVLRSKGLRRGDRIGIFADNSPEWAFCDWACSSMGVVTVPIFPSLPADQANFIFTDAGVDWVVVGSQDHAKRVSAFKTLFLKNSEESLDELSRTVSHDSFDEWRQEAAIGDPEDLATLIYTSGTTGRPKGVMLPHRAIAHVCEEARKVFPVDANDVFLSCLPMSHIFERVAGQALPISIGASIAYSRGLLTLGNDIVTAQPTIMLSVPRLLDAIRGRILDNAEKAPWLDRKLFALAMRQGELRAAGKPAPIAWLTDLFVLFPVRDKVFGRMRYIVSGGAALPGSVARFYYALGVTVLQGYGLTETAGGTCVNHPKTNRSWTVGKSLGMEIKIAEDGEILLRGGGLMLGYLNLPEDTKFAIDQEGWFHTGDIGLLEDGYLQITDRKKDLIVLANGKNVAPQPIENRLKESPLVAEAVVLGDGMDHVIALIVPNFERLKALGYVSDNQTELLAHSKVREQYKLAVDQVNSGLPDFERIRRYVLLENPFAVDTGELTPTMKVKRQTVTARYKDTIDSLR